MCVICVKRKGIRLPTIEEIQAMWARNPQGAGFMYARDGVLHIEKGFMSVTELLNAMHWAQITAKDPLIIHFRISTQAGVNAKMCHPFPISHRLADMERLSITPEIGMAHNGIIARTTEPKSKYSDTALFAAKYASELYRESRDVSKRTLHEAVQALAPHNKFALMNKRGIISLIGDFIEVDGLLYSNLHHVKNYIYQRNNDIWL